VERDDPRAPAVDWGALTPAGEAAGDDDEDTRLLAELIEEARRYLEGFDWCERVEELWFGDGVGGVVAVVLARLTPARPEVDELLWVVVGDIPPLYLVTDDAPTPHAALAAYVELADEWVDAVRAGRATDELMPVDAPPTHEWADALERRLRMLETEVLGTER
jgi:hypothetical protein